MLNINDILETINMIREENLDIRTITMGISLIDCAGDDINAVCDRVYDKITTKAARLVSVGDDIEKQYGIPIVNRRVAVTPVSAIDFESSSDPVTKTLAHVIGTVFENVVGVLNIFLRENDKFVDESEYVYDNF